jgi:hypothetical protein
MEADLDLKIFEALTQAIQERLSEEAGKRTSPNEPQ